MVRVSSHALDRIHNRSLMYTTDVRNKIANKQFIDIGKEPNTNKHHLLFYSRMDSQCFVAIVDVKDQFVITVLPIDYHNTCAWHVSDDVQAQAKELILSGKPKPRKNQNLPPQYKLKGVISKYKGTQKVYQRINLSVVKRASCGPIDELSNNEHFCNIVRKKATNKMNSQNLNGFDLEGVFVYNGVGKKATSDPIYYDVKDFKY